LATSELLIREATPSDRGAIEEVTLASYAQFGELMLPDHWAYYQQSILATLSSVGSTGLASSSAGG
jgi:hypothetical protein